VIQPIAAQDAWPLRREVLHPTRPLPTTLDPLDAVPDARHLGWFEAGRLVGTGSISRHPLPFESDAVAWFIRAMTVAQDWRSRGIVGRLLDALIAHGAAHDPNGIAWCHARLPAEAFYARHGFQTLDQVDLPEKGPRQRMRRALVLT
jgi:predicted GNAT family N-acyltransferase